MQKINGSILRWWVTPKLPKEHFLVPSEKRGKGLSLLKFLVFTFLLHPVKRRIAKYYLVFLRIFGLKVICVTGSAGKTTTKEMIASVLSQKGKTIWSQANIDSVYNIPTTILRCTPLTRFLVLEMGVEYRGEMDFYLWLAKPDVSVLTSLYLTHTQFLGSLEGVVFEKTKMIKAVTRSGYVVLNADDERVYSLRKIVFGKVIFFGLSKKAQVRASNIEITKDFQTKFKLYLESGSIQVELNILGEQAVQNALAASAVGVLFGVEIEAVKNAVQNFNLQPHRMQPIKIKRDVWVIDDTYNSNPLALGKSLETLAQVPGKRRIAILGEMKELGRFEEFSHRNLGKKAADLGIDLLFCFGQACRFLVDSAKKNGVAGANIFESKEEISRSVKKILKQGDVVLVKGSRSLEMETIVDSIASKS